MIILIAESKTMVMEEHVVTPECYKLHTPCGESQAAGIMSHLTEMSVDEIVNEVKISGRMAVYLKQMAYEFPNKTCGVSAVEAFTGVVFKNLDYTSLSLEGKRRAVSEVRIISSLYGWLKPDDIIKPYRLEYTSPLSPNGKSLSSYWKSYVTIQLVRRLQEVGEHEILDLLPADANKCVDWKLVKRFAKVYKVDFKEQDGVSVKTPHAGRLKALRGELLRNILENRIASAAELKAFENNTFMSCPEPDYPDRISFYV